MCAVPNAKKECANPGHTYMYMYMMWGFIQDFKFGGNLVTTRKSLITIRIFEKIDGFAL